MSLSTTLHHVFLSTRTPALRNSYRGSRITFDIVGEPVWFWSDDAPLTATPEAMAVLCTASAALTGIPLKVPLPVCPQLIENLHTLERIWADWWGTHTGRCDLQPAATHRSESNQHRSIGACFTCGADSFHTLLQRPDIDTLVYVWGYDVRLSEAKRFRQIEQAIRKVGKESQKNIIIIRTNLRDHAGLGSISWDRFHGAALALIGHLLRNHLRELLISASYPANDFHPWGSSWKTDPLWSSDAMQIEHVGHLLTRPEKLAAISCFPLAQRHLRVCWEHRNARLNCGSCEKCIRTMLGLLSAGKLASFKTLPTEAKLKTALRKLHQVPEHTFGLYQNILKHGLPQGMAKEVEDLLRRSHCPSGAPSDVHLQNPMEA